MRARPNTGETNVRTPGARGPCTVYHRAGSAFGDRGSSSAINSQQLKRRTPQGVEVAEAVKAGRVATVAMGRDDGGKKKRESA